MAHLGLWLFKFVLQTAVIGALLPLFAGHGERNLERIVLLGVVMSLVTFVLGDLLILPKLGQKSGIIGDFLLAYVVLWLGPLLLEGSRADRPYTIVGAVLVAAVVALAEFFFHPLLARYLHMQAAGLTDR